MSYPVPPTLNHRFAPITIFPSGGAAQYTATADVNGDGKEDVIVSNLNGVISVLLGTGRGGFAAPKTIITLPAGLYPILAADFNHDGKTDLAVVKEGSSQVAIYLGRGDGSFEAPKTFSTGQSPFQGVYPFQIVSGDVNGDGDLDLIVSVGLPSSPAYPGGGGVGGFSVLLGEGNGSFHAALVVTGQNNGSGGPLAVGDVNGDGRLAKRYL